MSIRAWFQGDSRRQWLLGVTTRVLALAAASSAWAGSDRPLDRQGYLALGGDPQVFEKYAKQPYVYLLKEESRRVTAGKTRVRIHDVIAVTSSAGRDMGTRKLTLSKAWKLSDLRCGTMAPNNVLIPLPKENLHEKKVGNFVEYTILLPSVAEGSILDFGYQREADFTVAYREMQAGDVVPVLHARLIVECDDTVSPSVYTEQCPPELQVQKHVEGDLNHEGGLVRYDFFNLQPLTSEPLAPPFAFRVPEVIMYLTGRRNWNYMAYFEERWYRRACSIEDSQEAKKLVQRLTANLTTPEAKCAAVLRFVRNEIQILDESNDFDPYLQPATETLEARAGSSNDAAGLAIGLLRLAGVEVQLALARQVTSGDWNAEVYLAGQFDRFVPRMRASAGWQWFEPLCRECVPGDLDWRVRGTKGILFQSDVKKELGEAIERARKSEDDDKSLQYIVHNAHWVDVVDVGDSPEWDGPSRLETTSLQVDESGTLLGDLELRLTDTDKLEVRRELLEANEAARKSWCQTLLQRRHAAAELVDVQFHGLDPDLSRSASLDTLDIRIRFQVPSFLPRGGRAVVSGAFFTRPIRNPIGEGKRQSDIWQLYSQGERSEVVLKLPPGATVARPPAGCAVEGETMRYASEFQQLGDAVHYTRVFTTRKGQFPASSVEAIRATYGKVLASENERVEIVSAGATATR